MSRPRVHKLAMEDAILLAMLRAAGDLSWNQARFILGGRMPTTTLRMLMAEGVIEQVADWSHNDGKYRFTQEGRGFAEAVELRLFEAGIIELADRADRRVA